MRYRKLRPEDDLHAQKKPAPVRRMIILILNTVLIAGFYIVAMTMHWAAVVYLYVISLTVLLCAVVGLNRGFHTAVPTRDQLSDQMTEEEKTEYLRIRLRDHEISRKLMTVLIPLLFTVGGDLIYMNFLAR